MTALAKPEKGEIAQLSPAVLYANLGSSIVFRFSTFDEAKAAALASMDVIYPHPAIKTDIDALQAPEASNNRLHLSWGDLDRRGPNVSTSVYFFGPPPDRPDIQGWTLSVDNDELATTNLRYHVERAVGQPAFPTEAVIGLGFGSFDEGRQYLETVHGLGAEDIRRAAQSHTYYDMVQMLQELAGKYLSSLPEPAEPVDRRLISYTSEVNNACIRFRRAEAMRAEHEQTVLSEIASLTQALQRTHIGAATRRTALWCIESLTDYYNGAELRSSGQDELYELLLELLKDWQTEEGFAVPEEISYDDEISDWGDWAKSSDIVAWLYPASPDPDLVVKLETKIKGTFTVATREFNPLGGLQQINLKIGPRQEFYGDLTPDMQTRINQTASNMALQPPDYLTTTLALRVDEVHLGRIAYRILELHRQLEDSDSPHEDQDSIALVMEVQDLVDRWFKSYVQVIRALKDVI